jgi:purine-binding chemotaxis protein CheW
MDIAKIRKKAKEQGAEKRPDTPPVPMPPEPEVGASPEGGATEVPEPREAEEREEAPAYAEDTDAAYAGPEGEESGEGYGQVELLTFRLGSEEFAFRVEDVEEIVRMQNITMVPTMPSYMAGITSLRGKIIPVIDLKSRLNLGRLSQGVADEGVSGGKAAAGKILIVDGQRGFIGAIDDRVIGVVRLSQQELLDPPAHLTEAEKKYIEGIVILDKRFISVVRPEDTMEIAIG